MAKFIKIERTGCYLDLEKIEGVDFKRREVWCSGSETPYSLFTDTDIARIEKYVKANEYNE